MDVERIRYVRLAGKCYVAYFTEFKDIVLSSQEEQPCLHDVEASSIAHNKTVRR